MDARSHGHQPLDQGDGLLQVRLPLARQAEDEVHVGLETGLAGGGHGRKDMDPKAVDEAGVKTTSKCPRCGFEW